MDNIDKAEEVMLALGLASDDRFPQSVLLRSAIMAALDDNEDDVIRVAKVSVAEDSGTTRDAWLLASTRGDSCLIYEKPNGGDFSPIVVDLLVPSLSARVRYEFDRQPRLTLEIDGRAIGFKWKTIREFEDGKHAWVRHVARSLTGCVDDKAGAWPAR